MTDDTYVTRREIDLLKHEADVERARMWAKIESLDEHGSRGVGALTVRMDSLVQTVSELKTEVQGRADAHDLEHEREETKRATARRWLVATIIAAVAATDGPIVTVVLARGR